MSQFQPYSKTGDYNWLLFQLLAITSYIISFPYLYKKNQSLFIFNVFWQNEGLEFIQGTQLTSKPVGHYT